VAQVDGNISHATGSFTHVSPNITETDSQGSAYINQFTLQLNSNFGSQSVVCQAGPYYGKGCYLWQQFMYSSDGTGPSPADSAPAIYMQYWVINLGEPCYEIGWQDAGVAGVDDCYTNSAAAQLPQPLAASDLGSVALTGTVTAATDTVSLTLDSAAYAATGDDLGLYGNWNQTQWGVYGVSGTGKLALFSPGSHLEADTAFAASTGAAPNCVEEINLPDTTGELNNLNLSTTTAPPSPGDHPMVSSFQTTDTPGAATCSAQPVGIAPSISPAAYSVTHLPAGTSSYSCPSGQLCLQVNDATTKGTTVFDLYYCKTYALSHWYDNGTYIDNQTGTSTTTYFYGASTSQVLAQFTPTGTKLQTFDWTPVNWIKAC
jgi:hypothetical protein